MRRISVLLLGLALAGCGGSGGASISKEKLPQLVLQQSDLPRYVSFLNGPQAHADMHPGPREDPGRFGRLGGWIARYRRTGGVSIRTKGPLVVESRADVFPSASAAKKDLRAYEQEYEAQPAEVGVARLDAPELGDGAVALRFGSGLDRFVLVAWRKANATASLLVEGSSVTLADAVRLARLQQARVAKAAA